MSKTTTKENQMTTEQRIAATLHTYRVGSKHRLPDGPCGVVESVERGEEHGEPVVYVTVNGQTRWVSI